MSKLFSKQCATLMLCFTLFFPSMSCADDPISDFRDGFNKLAKDFNESKQTRNYGSCLWRIMWDSIKEKGKIDDEYYGKAVIRKCYDYMIVFSRFSGSENAGVNQLAIVWLFDYLAAGKKKFTEEGRQAFEWMEEVNYDGTPNIK